MKIELSAVPLPDFGLPQKDVEIPATTFKERLMELERRYAGRGLDAIVVYGDREHFANLAYLTNYDPRFEESLLILQPGKRPNLLVGNEGMAYATAVVPIPVEFTLYQPLSLLSQPRDTSPGLRQALRKSGVKEGMKVGTVGWKYFGAGESDNPRRWVELPHFMVECLRELGCTVENATDLLMHPETGLRANNDVDQLAYFEAAASYSSTGVRDILRGIHPGMTEFEGIQLAKLNGWPTSMYPILLGGKRTQLGLASPSHHRLQLGDPVVTCIGLWGGNTCRAGFLAKGPEDLPAGPKDYVERLAIPYFRSAVAWYETIGLNVLGRDVFEAVHAHVGDPFFGVNLNPGHLIHLDEWVSSPIARNTSDTLRSGMALQLDIIPGTGTEYWTSNVEDGVALADEPLRQAFAKKYPEAWIRIQKRKAFMKEGLGINLKPEVLPFSNIPGYLPPFWLSPGLALRRL
jgi:hypothetical protein